MQNPTSEWCLLNGIKMSPSHEITKSLPVHVKISGVRCWRMKLRSKRWDVHFAFPSPVRCFRDQMKCRTHAGEKSDAWQEERRKILLFLQPEAWDSNIQREEQKFRPPNSKFPFLSLRFPDLDLPALKRSNDPNTGAARIKGRQANSRRKKAGMDGWREKERETPASRLPVADESVKVS